MAVYNPPINLTPDPDYTRSSRPISVPDTIDPKGTATNTIMPHGVKEGDRSGEYLGKAEASKSMKEAIEVNKYSDLFSGVVKGVDYLTKVGDTLIKKDIENSVYDQANAERELYTAELEAIRRKPGLGNFLDANASMDENIPGELQNLSGSLEHLTSANAAGKISNTQYTGRLLAIAKDLRAKYPGYRSYIDQQIAQVTGMNPANAYIQSLSRDINAQVAQLNKARSSAESYITKNMQFPGAVQVLEKFRNGEMSDVDVYKWGSTYEGREYNYKMRGLERTDLKGTREEISARATDLASRDMYTFTSNFLDRLTFATGMDKPEKVMDVIRKVNSGQYTAEQIQVFGQFIASQIPQIRQNLWNMANAPGPNNTPSYAQLLEGGPTAVNKMIDDQIAQVQQIVDNIYNKDMGAAYLAKNRVTAQIDDTKFKIYKDPRLGTPLALTHAFNEAGGQAIVGQLSIQLLSKGLGEATTSFLDDATKAMMGQATMKADGTPTTLTDVFRNAKEQKITSPEAGRALIETMTGILTDPTKYPEAIKRNTIQALFSPENKGFIAKLNKDTRDSRGRIVPGQWATFRELTKPEITKTMVDIRNKDPQAWANYKDWAENEFRNLFVREIKDLANAQDTTGLVIKWDSDKNQFSISNTNRRPTGDVLSTGTYSDVPFTQAERARENLYREGIRKLNLGIDSMSGIAAVEGDDVSAYLFQLLKNAGYSPSDKVQGLPQAIQEAIMNSKLSVERTKQRTNKSAEELYGN